MIKQFAFIVAALVYGTVAVSQKIQKQTADTVAYRANDRLKNAGPKNGWPIVEGMNYASGLLIMTQVGLASYTGKNFAAGMNIQNGLLVGAGIELLLLDAAATGRIPVGLQYQFAAFLVEGIDVASGAPVKNNVRLQYLKVPLQYQFYIDRNDRLFVGAGGYAALLISKQQTVNMFKLDDMNKGDAGVVLSAGYRLAAQWMIQANAQWGLTTLEKESINAYLNRNRCYTLSFLYAPFAPAKGKPVFGPIIKIKPKG